VVFHYDRNDRLIFLTSKLSEALKYFLHSLIVCRKQLAISEGEAACYERSSIELFSIYEPIRLELLHMRESL